LARLLDTWGVAGTYDLLFVPFDGQSQANLGYAVVNFIDPVFVPLFCFLWQNQVYGGVVVPADVQGAEANRAQWMQYSTPDVRHLKLIALEGTGGLGFKPSGMPPEQVSVEAVEPQSWADRNGLELGDLLMSMNGWLLKDMTSEELMTVRRERPLQLMFERRTYLSEPFTPEGATPTQWAVNTVNTMLSPHNQEHFHKTKMCTFYQQGRCDRGSGCPFAHHKSELLPSPDLVKTKLCYSYFRGKCNDRRCKFAHGSRELRATWDMNFASGALFMDGGPHMYPGYEVQEEDAAVLDGVPGMQGYLIGVGEVGVGEIAGSGVAGASPEQISALDAGFGRQVSSSHLSEDGSELRGPCTASGSSGADSHQSRRVASFDRHSTALGPLGGIRELGTSYVRESFTFMETLESKEPLPSLTRSWSDSDLSAFRDALDDSALGRSL
jgi:hypothetical protein